MTSRRRGLIRLLREHPQLRTSALLGPPTFWMVAFLTVPLLFMVAYGFSVFTATYKLVIPFPDLYLDNYAAALDPSGPIIALFTKTLGIAVAATLGSLLLGYPIAYYIGRIAPEKWRGVLLGLIIIPFWVSFVVRALSIVPFMQDDGVLDATTQTLGIGFVGDWFTGLLPFNSRNIAVVVLIYVWLPFMVLPVFTSVSRLDSSLLEAAMDLGASRLRTFRSVTLPLTLPGIVMGSVLVFITSLGSFVEVSFFAVRLVGTFVYEQLESVNFPKGVAAAVLITSLTLLMIWIYIRFVLAGEPAREARPSRRRKLSDAIARLGGRIVAAGSRALGEIARSFRSARGPVATTAAQEAGRAPRHPITRAIDRIVEVAGTRILAVITIASFIALYAPLAFIAVFSFNDAVSATTWEGFTTKWYIPSPRNPDDPYTPVPLFDPEGDALQGLYLSVVVGLAATGIALFLGTMGAYALHRYQVRWRGGFQQIMYLGLVIPSIVLGLALLILFRGLDIGTNGRGILQVIIGHSTFTIPIATIVLGISVRDLDPSLEEAAMDLGADELATFRRITLPLLKPGMVSAALLAFTFSFDELVTTLFLTPPNAFTLPVVIWGTLRRRSLDPGIYAICTLILVLAIVFVLLAQRVQKGGALFRLG